MWSVFRTRKFSSSSQSSPEQPAAGSCGHLANGGSPADDSEPTTPRSGRRRYRKVTAPAAVSGTCHNADSDRVVYDVDLTQSPPDVGNNFTKWKNGGSMTCRCTRGKQSSSSCDADEDNTAKSIFAGRIVAKRRGESDFTSIMEKTTEKAAMVAVDKDAVVNADEREWTDETRTVIDANSRQDPDDAGRRTSIEPTANLGLETKLIVAGNILRAVMFSRSPALIRDQTDKTILDKRSVSGMEMVDWLMQNSIGLVQTRLQAIGVWQSLLEEGLLEASGDLPFMDTHLLYRWTDDKMTQHRRTSDQHQYAQADFIDALGTLSHFGQDVLFRMILSKPPQERTSEELEIVFDELLNIKALSNLSTTVKRELSAVMAFEQYSNVGTILFRQGDEGESWYIILKGSVNVVVHGKGTVCTLYEGDDFGKLALVNDAPRAATIISNEENCHFLRVDKSDFNRILRDVEANTVRLKEHGKDVLVLEKVKLTKTTSNGLTSPALLQQRYSIVAGTPEKILEYFLDTAVSFQKNSSGSYTFLDDFLLTHTIFMPSSILCNALNIYYRRGCLVSNQPNGHEIKDDSPGQFHVSRRRVIAFLHHWANIGGHTFYHDPVTADFVETIYSAILEDCGTHPSLSTELRIMETLMAERERVVHGTSYHPRVVLNCGMVQDDSEIQSPVLPSDTCVFKVYNSDGAHVTLKARVDQPVSQIRRCAAEKLGLTGSGNEDAVALVEVKSSGERIVFASTEISVPSLISLNSCIFVCAKDQLDCLVPLPDQEGPMDSVHSIMLDVLGSFELAHHMLITHWRLFSNTHPNEFIHQTFGRGRFDGGVPTNLDLLIRRFNEIQFWVVTEIVLCPNVTKRAGLVKKFIKVAAYSKAMHDLFSFFAITFGLSNVAVNRLAMTWEKVPTKFRKQFMEFESLLDPSRNHRAYRLLLSKTPPPIIPFVPLILKDLTFAHHGNKTHIDGLVNFEKVRMVAHTLRSIRYCKMRPLPQEVTTARVTQETEHLVRNFKVIDDQKRLLFLSQKIEPRKQSC